MRLHVIELLVSTRAVRGAPVFSRCSPEPLLPSSSSRLSPQALFPLSYPKAPPPLEPWSTSMSADNDGIDTWRLRWPARRYNVPPLSSGGRGGPRGVACRRPFEPNAGHALRGLYDVAGSAMTWNIPRHGPWPIATAPKIRT